MARLSIFVAAAFFVSIILVDFGAQARHCNPPCEFGERCVSANRRERRHSYGSSNVCVPTRCLFRARRGRCLNHQRRFHFNPITMSCNRVRTGACYGRNNRFFTREDCELICTPWRRR